MSYLIYYSNSNRTPNSLTIEVGKVNNEHDIPIFGMAATEWAPDIQQGILYRLENFASSLAPARPTQGQLWYDSDIGILKKTGDGATWDIQELPYFGPIEPTVPGKPWYDTTEQALKLYTKEDHIDYPDPIPVESPPILRYVDVMENYYPLTGGPLNGPLRMHNNTVGIDPNLTIEGTLIGENLLIENGVLSSSSTYGLWVTSGQNLVCSDTPAQYVMFSDDLGVYGQNIILKPSSYVSFHAEGNHTLRLQSSDNNQSYVPVDLNFIPNTGVQASTTSNDFINRQQWNDAEDGLTGRTGPDKLYVNSTNSMIGQLTLNNLTVKPIGTLAKIEFSTTLTSGHITSTELRSDYRDFGGGAGLGGSFEVKNNWSSAGSQQRSCYFYWGAANAHQIGSNGATARGRIANAYTRSTSGGGDDTDGATRKYMLEQLRSNSSVDYSEAIAWGRFDTDSLRNPVFTGNTFNIQSITYNGINNQFNVVFDSGLISAGERYAIILSPVMEFNVGSLPLSGPFPYEKYEQWTQNSTAYVGSALPYGSFEVDAINRTNSGFSIITRGTKNHVYDSAYYGSGIFSLKGIWIRRSRFGKTANWRCFVQRFQTTLMQLPRLGSYNFVVYKTQTTNEDTWG